MGPFSLLNSAASKRSSLSDKSRRSSLTSQASSISYMPSLPSPAMLKKKDSKKVDSNSARSKPDIAEMLDDDNLAWGRPRNLRR
ncbi:hypothetical protein A0H81_00357 [Grifola frondosa]|uniref:Uncharacterized protein n=1 Tax=Grifola frondosa TaxID=5627 RepID=A0A1C7MSA2_GRIFR|nr:hypothetical protein A0H81_00357 [Grifola frondosa]